MPETLTLFDSDPHERARFERGAAGRPVRGVTPA
jgi:hypothetical protein